MKRLLCILLMTFLTLGFSIAEGQNHVQDPGQVGIKNLDFYGQAFLYSVFK